MSQNQNDEGGAERAAARESRDLKHKFVRAVKGWELRDRKLGAMGSETRIPQLPGRWGGGGEWRLIPRSIVGHMQPLDLSPAAPRSPARVLPDCFSASLWPQCLPRLCQHEKGSPASLFSTTPTPPRSGQLWGQEGRWAQGPGLQMFVDSG